MEREQASSTAKPKWTLRQREVLDLLARGYTNPQIAEALGVTLDGAKWHVREVLTKLGVANREEAAEWWRRERSPLARALKRLRSVLAVPFGRVALAAASASGAGIVAVVTIVALHGGGDGAQDSATPPVSTDVPTVAGQVPVSATPDASVARLPGGDGPKVAWVSGGDIWVKALNGQAVRITLDGRDANPRWSASGKWLAFQRPDGVWVTSEAGLAVLLPGSTEKAFAWAPETDVIAYETDGNVVVGFKVESGKTTFSIPECGGFAWSPDGARLACTHITNRPDGTRYGTLSNVEAATRAETTLVTLEGGDLVPAKWSGDGASILYWENAGFSASLQAGGLTLKSIPAVGGASITLGHALTYSDFIAVESGHVAAVDGGGREAWDGEALALGDVSRLELKTSRAESVASIDWSPDGADLAYSSMPAVQDISGGETARLALMQRRIWGMDLATGATKRLTDDPAYRDEYPQWSADGKAIVFVRIDNENRGSIWTMPAAGGIPTLIADSLDLDGGLEQPNLRTGWFGYYGHIDWAAVFDYWPG